MTHAVQIRELHKSFGQLEVLKGIDFTVDTGQVVCVIGPSGSGKSTLLRCVNLLEEPTSGQVIVNGVELTDPDADIDAARRRIGMVFQSFNLFPHLTALENVTIAQRRVLKRGKARASQLAMRNLEKVGIRPSFPAGSSSGWPSPGRCPWTRS
jgi:polar amino acid transport system ATP-binding protein